MVIHLELEERDGKKDRSPGETGTLGQATLVDLPETGPKKTADKRIGAFPAHLIKQWLKSRGTTDNHE
jgi:hypothetical protein